MEKEIQYVTVAGRTIAAVHAICPVCQIFYLDMVFDTTTEPWTAKCPKLHTWQIPSNS